MKPHPDEMITKVQYHISIIFVKIYHTDCPRSAITSLCFHSAEQ
jgi:hypothetical protein